VAHEQQVLHIRHPCSHHWHLSIGPPWHEGVYYGTQVITVKCL